MSDGEYIRKTDYKDFKEEPDHNGKFNWKISFLWSTIEICLTFEI
jgi:hypothetical protein